MKILIRPLLFTTIFLIVSCDVDFDINERDSKADIFANIWTTKTDNGVIQKSTLHLDLMVRDSDGVSSIFIYIPLLDVQFSSQNSSFSDKMNILYDLEIDSSLNSNKGIIYITVLDREDKSYEKQYDFILD